MINQSTLDSILKILKENQICCGIGGSYLLQVYHLCEEPKDVDFWVAPEDISKVRKIFSQYEEIEEKIQLPAEYHFKMQYDDIQVDFVACFIVQPNQNKFVYNIMPENIKLINVGDDRILPCTSLEDWYIVYKLLKRHDKAELIKKYIYQKNIEETNASLQMSIDNENNKLPRQLTDDVKDFIWNNMQYNIPGLYNEQEEKND